MNYSLNQQTLILSIQYIKDSVFGLVYTAGNKTDLVPIANAIDSPDCSGLIPAPQRLPATNACHSARGTVHRGRVNASALNWAGERRMGWETSRQCFLCPSEVQGHEAPVALCPPSLTRGTTSGSDLGKAHTKSLPGEAYSRVMRIMTSY